MSALDKGLAAIDDATKAIEKETGVTTEQAVNEAKAPHPQQQKKQKKAKKPKKAGKPQEPTHTVMQSFNKAFLQVSEIVSCEDHPVADKLYLMKLKVTEEADAEPLTFVAGIKLFYSKEELVGRKVCTILNLKPAKLAGTLSEAMLLAASVVSAEGAKETVKLVAAPEGSVVGDRIFVRPTGELAEGLPTDSTIPLADNLAKSLADTARCAPKQWDRVVANLMVEGGKATLCKHEIVTSKGALTADLPDGAEIH